jgi:hypothetical protein
MLSYRRRRLEPDEPVLLFNETMLIEKRHILSFVNDIPGLL